MSGHPVTPTSTPDNVLHCECNAVFKFAFGLVQTIKNDSLIETNGITRGQSNLTKSASRGAHSPVRGSPPAGGRNLYH